jgi:hypothetical protein
MGTGAGQLKLLMLPVWVGMAHVSLLSTPMAQTPKLPDFMGPNRGGWVTNTADFLPIPGEQRPTWNDPAHPRISNAESARTGKQPTDRIPDLSNPNIKPWAIEIMRKDSQEVIAGKKAYMARAACMPGGVPNVLTFPMDNMYFIQTPNTVKMVFSGVMDVRHIFLNVPHSANVEPSWYGESVGHYEGDTLVVDTIGLNGKSFLDAYRTPHSRKLHVVEHWRVVEDGKKLEVKVRVEDPDTFYQPWWGTVLYNRSDEPMEEIACAENNQQLFDYGTPVAQRPDF